MSADFEHLEKVQNTRRCPRQKAVIRELLKGHFTVRPIARALGVTDNAVNIALSELKSHGIVEVPIRGRFYVKEELIALVLFDRVRALEKRMVKGGGAKGRSSQAPRSASIAAAQPASGGEPR